MTDPVAAPVAPAAPAAPAAALAPAPAPAPAAPTLIDSAAPAPAAPAEGVKTAEAVTTMAPEQQAEADTAAAAEAAAAEAAKGAPEKYADFTPPEGTVLDAGLMTEFADAARELNLPQDAAQKMVDKMAPVMAKQQAAAVEAASVAWTEQASTDPEYGGTRLAESMTFAAKAMDKFGTPELKALMNESRLGNHPEIVRFMVRAGKAMTEDGIVTGGIPASGGGIRSVADRLYPASSKPK